ncbi:hypothetical protein PGT21_001486 [Puccinia graminis f. sp. tritici]|uniref:Exopolyphosphatase n=2 Tax=Puccinia graminis f. sp. tritici TaxID=56615 RepID=E3K975_PUCGT|nr:uncharacterized protein PGTG_07102 [Puccinia graminis f. sp. tritici CRL 75-36-700-3]EFP80850.1 hypothetical protein PGTG_07102 [Puccinia graminis f. sp. tritici CRL 75-36-700-3]KAA1068776.1 hypothetical protein PGT21_001384 [Puccinia graminis f. sp. tritici]KAA1080084.1 hypothetical protein PGTUg99_006791 [Puccinia graminis f. sp. tritici]KAA1103816.1 hypothetical protein PGT21_001486 [Puccinia graminis f. sp. tritici]
MLLRPLSALLFIHLSILVTTVFSATNGGQQTIFQYQGHPISPNLSVGIAQEGTGVLSKWARESRSQFFSDITQNRASEWVIVMGNEAGDTDSMAAAIGWAYHLSHVTHNPQKAIALLQTVEDALDLRPENQLALERSQMSSRHRDLLTIDELPIKPFELSHRLAGIVLVDHNVPAPGWRQASLLSIIDHHVDQKLNLSADPRVLEEAASCSSLVADLMLESEARGEHRVVSGEKYGIPTDLVDLMLRAIFLDSDALSSKKHYDVDKRASYGLFRLRKSYAPPDEYYGKQSNVRGELSQASRRYLLDDNQRHKWEKRELRKLATNFWAEMSEARGQLQQLDVRDLLRRDWKVNAVKTATIKYPYLTLGFASIPCSIQKQVERTPEQTVPEWFAIERAFTSEIGADVSVVLTKFKSEITGKAEREIMLVVAHGWGKRLTTLAATDLFLTLCKNIEDHFEGLQEWARSDNKPLLPRRKGWIMTAKGRPMGRKVLMPLVLKAASEWNWNTTEGVVGDD